jgi:hypothetical protein
MNSKRANQGKEEKSCADYARSYVRGFITVYIAWFLGVDAEDGFWTTYFKPLERLWTINRAQKDISLMRGEGLVDKDRLRFTEKGWGCMEEAIVRFLKGEFGEYQSINIIKEYPETVLVAPGFAYEHGVDILDVISVRTIVNRSGKMFEVIYLVNTNNERGEVSREVSPFRSYRFLMELLKLREVGVNDPLFMVMRVSIGLLVRAAIADREFVAPVDGAPSRWLIPLIPYLANLGFGTNLIEVIEVKDLYLRKYSDMLERVIMEGVDIEPFVKSRHLEFVFSRGKQMLRLVLQP